MIAHPEGRFYDRGEHAVLDVLIEIGQRDGNDPRLRCHPRRQNERTRLNLSDQAVVPSGIIPLA